MSKFNKKVSNVTSNSTNMAGGESFIREDIRMEIASLVLNSMINGDSCYESEKDRIERIIKTVKGNLDISEFIAKAMVYTRNEGNLRSVSHLMGTILAENVKGVDFLKPALIKTLIRPDDATEMVSLFLSRNKNTKVPNILQRAIKESLESKWDEYQLKKYTMNSNEVKLKDLVKMFRPNSNKLISKGKTSDENVFKKVIEDSLKNISTAQTVNAAGTGENRKDAYKDMLKNKKLGYMAAIKNIKNILESGVGEKTVDRLCDLLRNERACLNSRVLPFRFTQAYTIVNGLSLDRLLIKKVLLALEDGFILSAKNISIVENGESVALLLDESGSMGGYYSDDIDGKTPFMIGKTLMASMLTGLDKSKTIGYLWADRAREISIEGRPFEFMKNTETQGGGTDLRAAFKGLVDTKTKVDKIVIITDGQGWRATHSELKKYVAEYKKISPNVKILFWNVEGYAGGTPLKLSHDILEVVGFSDKMLDVIPKMWKDPKALIKEIESIKLI